MEKRRVLYLIQFPPPVHGVSVLNRIVWDDATINQNIDKRLLPIQFAKQLQELRVFRFKKIIIAAVLYFKLLYQLIVFRPHAVYFSFMPIGIAFWRDFFYLMTIKAFGVKTILHLDNQGISEKSKKTINRTIYQFAFKGCNIIHVNEWLLNKEFEKLKVKNARFYFVHNTIEPQLEVKVDYQKKKSQILFLSHLFKEKGADVLIKSFKILHESNPELKLVIAGDSPSTQILVELKNNVSKANLDDSVTFTGAVWGEFKNTLIANSCMLVLPSSNDCFPLVILEALHYGIPVITTNSGGLKTIFNDGVDMVFIDKPDPTLLAEKIKYLLSNTSMMTEIGENGKAKATQMIDEFPTSMRKIFEEVLRD